MKSLKNIVTAVVIASGIVATLGSAVQAGDWRGRRGYDPGYGGPAPRYHAPRHNPYYGYGYGHEQRRDRTGEKIAKGVAIGVGAIILGTILANEARRHREYEGY